jgi:hypothetical protein
VIRQALTSLVTITGVLVLAELAKSIITGKHFSLPPDFLLLLIAAVVGSMLVGQMKLGRR